MAAFPTSMSLFPATAGEFPEAEAYNAAIRSFGSNLRDFQAAHYLSQPTL